MRDLEQVIMYCLLPLLSQPVLWRRSLKPEPELQQLRIVGAGAGNF